jgi:hypothetical protein
MEEVLPPSAHEVMPPTAPPAQDEIQKSSRDTSTSGDAATAKQTIVEVPNGATIDGQPLQPGPQYKRGRGRSFFKDAPRKGVSCQGRCSNCSEEPTKQKITGASRQCNRILTSNYCCSAWMRPFIA